MSDHQQASERTEEPSEKKLKQAVEKGNLPKSPEVGAWFVIASCCAIAAFASSHIGLSLLSVLRRPLSFAAFEAGDGERLMVLLWDLVGGLALAGAPFFATLIVGSLAGHWIQHRPVFTAEPIKPRWSKVSPAAGLKRLFSPTALVNFAKALAKLILIGSAMAVALWWDRDDLALLIDGDPAFLLSVLHRSFLTLFLVALPILGLVALSDLAWQRHSWRRRLRMTVREVRDERKEAEGDPQIKGRLQALRRRRRRALAAAVSEATAVVVNPTHYAVALKYERGMAAPVCVAKGVDHLALRIRKIAENHRIPIVREPLLARALYESTGIDEEIPPIHYRAVAEVIGYVMRLSRTKTI